jgi:hypothetical protein
MHCTAIIYYLFSSYLSKSAVLHQTFLLQARLNVHILVRIN